MIRRKRLWTVALYLAFIVAASGPPAYIVREFMDYYPDMRESYWQYVPRLHLWLSLIVGLPSVLYLVIVDLVNHYRENTRSE